jgi:hypothetical protein
MDATAIVVVVIATIASPTLLSLLTNRAARKAQALDWEREDKVARRLAESVTQTNGKLDVIHTLVNSNMTAAMEDALGSKVALLVALRRMAGDVPTSQEQTLIDTTESEIAERRAELHDRRQQAAIVLAHEKVGSE